jgi:signal transduction histidine kinase
MRWPTALRKWIVPLALVGCGLAVSAWQLEEHVRFERASKDALIKRGRDITSTLGVVLRSQRRYIFLSKERVEPSLQALVQPEELESIALLSVTGEPLASAGKPADLGPDALREKGVYWGAHTLTIMNLMDLGSGGNEDGSRPPTATIVMSEDERQREFPGGRPRPPRRPADAAAVPGVPGSPPAASPAGPATSAPLPAAASPAPAAESPPARPTLGRPSWMSVEQYETIIHQNGAHSLLISVSTDQMNQKIRSDLLLRSLVSILAMSAAIISSLAWRNAGKNAELQMRLIRAGEMNTHLKAMNFAAAGLAHETRNPLNLIRGFAQMIAMQETVPALKAHASQIIEEADRVTVQLNEFINYSKPREAHLAPVEVKRLVADVARTLLPDLEEKRITLVQPEAACVIEADEPLLRQALFNVLLNASQAVPPGGQIKVEVTQVGPREAVLEISDNGPGVPAAELENIFKPYVTMRPKGVGLGLAIVRLIASAHRWEVACIPNHPQGARFRFSRLRVAASHA